MEIVQVLIFMVIIAIAIVQQITKAKKETGTPSPREVLTDMFPTIEETEEEEQTISPRPIKCTPRPIRKKKGYSKRRNRNFGGGLKWYC